MTYRVILSQNAEKELASLDIITKKRIIMKLDNIKENPFNYVKRLTCISLYSLRVGNYRVILDIKNKQMVIFVIRVGHSHDVYT